MKKDYFTKNLSASTFFEINTSNLQEMFLDLFKKFCRKEFQKNIIFCFFLIIFLFIPTELS